MALPSVGSAISLSQIQSEFGGSNPISLSEYYGKGNAPGSGAITMSADFGGTSNAPPDPQTFSGAGTSNITIADNVQAIGVQLVGAGGGGAGAGGMFNFNGGGGGAGGNVIAYHNVSAGQTVSAIRGSGGAGVGMFTGGPNVGKPGNAGQSTRVTLAGSTIATGNGGSGGTAPTTGGSGGGTSTGGSVYNVTANTGNSGGNGMGSGSLSGGAGGSSPVGSGGANPNNSPGGAGGIGAGGGGAGSNMGIRSGGNGGAGYVKVTFYTSQNPPPDLSF
tara:strand:+ start:1039 stop:1863 length:825 start_codon:yes stop_codon:yes gene_type:complete